jgi:hypothetical protein
MSLKAIAIPSGGAWGGEYVTEEFNKFLAELLGPELYKPRESPYEFYQITSEFNRNKVLFDPSKDPANIRLVDVLENKRQLVGLAEAYNERFPTKPIVMGPTLRNGFLTMSKELMLSFFKPCLDATVAETAKVMKENPGIKTIIVVGGFGSSKVLTDRISTEFHMKGGVKVLLCDPNPKPQGAIAQGAVLFGLYKNIIDARLSPYTYGVAMRMNGKDDCFQVLVNKGEELQVDHQAFVFGLPIHPWPQQKQITWRFYRSDLAEPTTVNDPEHVVLLGTLTADCPDRPEQIQRKQMGYIKFGGPEIKVTIENAQGEKFTGAIVIK